MDLGSFSLLNSHSEDWEPFVIDFSNGDEEDEKLIDEFEARRRTTKVGIDLISEGLLRKLRAKMQRESADSNEMDFEFLNVGGEKIEKKKEKKVERQGSKMSYRPNKKEEQEAKLSKTRKIEQDLLTNPEYERSKLAYFCVKHIEVFCDSFDNPFFNNKFFTKKAQEYANDPERLERGRIFQSALI